MLEKSCALAGMPGLELQSFDLAILTSVLASAPPLRAGGHQVSFCTRDRDLLPWDGRGDRKPTLTRLYDEAEVWVFGDFSMNLGERPDPWP